MASSPRVVSGNCQLFNFQHPRPNASFQGVPFFSELGTKVFALIGIPVALRRFGGGERNESKPAPMPRFNRLLFPANS